MTISFEEDRITTFVTQIDWRPGAREILLKTTDIVLKNLAQEYVKQIIESETFKSMASEVFKKVSGEVAGAVASIVGIGIIKSIWTQNDAMARELNRLIREPFQTGTR